MIQKAWGYCAAAISIPFTCSIEIIPRALVKEKCVSAFESNRMMPRPSARSGGNTIGKAAAHSSFRALDSRGLPTSANLAISARCGLSASERLPARQSAGLIDQTNALAMKRVGRRQEPEPPQRSVRACREIEAGRIGAIDDVEVVVSRQNENPLGKPGIGRHRVEKFRPFRRTARIRHVAGDDNGVDGIFRMDANPSSASNRFKRPFPRGPARPLSIRKP